MPARIVQASPGMKTVLMRVACMLACLGTATSCRRVRHWAHSSKSHHPHKTRDAQVELPQSTGEDVVVPSDAPPIVLCVEQRETPVPVQTLATRGTVRELVVSRMDKIARAFVVTDAGLFTTVLRRGEPIAPLEPLDTAGTHVEHLQVAHARSEWIVLWSSALSREVTTSILRLNQAGDVIAPPKRDTLLDARDTAVMAANNDAIVLAWRARTGVLVRRYTLDLAADPLLLSLPGSDASATSLAVVASQSHFFAAWSQVYTSGAVPVVLFARFDATGPIPLPAGSLAIPNTQVQLTGVMGTAHAAFTLAFAGEPDRVDLDAGPISPPASRNNELYEVVVGESGYQSNNALRIGTVATLSASSVHASNDGFVAVWRDQGTGQDGVRADHWQRFSENGDLQIPTRVVSQSADGPSSVSVLGSGTDGTTEWVLRSGARADEVVVYAFDQRGCSPEMQ